jgi:hypothetical protein
MPKKYVIERHQFGMMVKVAEDLTKQEAEDMLHELNHDAQKPSIKYSMRAVRKRG